MPKTLRRGVRAITPAKEIDFFVRYPWGSSYMEHLMPALDRLHQPWIEDAAFEGSDAYRIFLADSKRTLRRAVTLIDRANVQAQDKDDDGDWLTSEEIEIQSALGLSSIEHDWKTWYWEDDTDALLDFGIQLRVAELAEGVFRVRLKRIKQVQSRRRTQKPPR